MQYKQPKIIKTLLISSVLIAVVVSAITLFLQVSHIEEKVLKLAKVEMKYFVKALQTHDSLSKEHIEIENSNFLAISLYNKSKKLLYTNKVKNYAQIQRDLKVYNHSLVTKSTQNLKEKLIHYHQKNKFYFQFTTAVKMKGFDGYIEGLYAISDEEMQGIYTSVLYSVLELVGSIFLTTLLLYPVIIYLNKAYILQSEELLHANLEIMSVLGDAIAKRDNETNAHNYRVTLYAIKFAEVLGVSKKEIQALIKGAFLHDVGKIGIPDGILLKPGKLTRDEFETMKQHVLHGLAIISRSKWLEEAKNVIEFHHEHYDGKGYLKGLRAEEIPLNARIFMICDVFDAFTSKRPYKEAFPLEESMHMIQERAGTHFDPKLVEVFLSFIADFYLKIANLEDLEALELHLDEKIEYLKL